MSKRNHERVLLIGGRSKAWSMATTLLEQGYRVTVVNRSREDCMHLAQLKGLRVICGDGTKPYVLDEADAALCDIAIALSSKDTDNLVACQLCKKQFGVKKTVSLVADPHKTAFFYQMGIDSVVCAVSAVTGIIRQQAFIDEIAGSIPVGDGRVQILEVQITEQSPAVGLKLWQIPLPQQTIVGCILRTDTALIPRGDTRILAGDRLVVLARSGQEREALRALTEVGEL